MIVDNKNKFIFIAIAKTACTSIHRRFGYHRDPKPHIYHMHLRNILKRHPESQDYYKFSFVRNPYDRLVSAFYNFRYHPEHKEWAYPIYEYNTFKDFVIDLKSSRCMEFIHLQTQFDFLQLNGKVDIDFVGKYENLNIDFKKVEDHLGFENVQLPITRTSKHPNYEDIYDSKMKKVVQEIYHNDFEEFGYEE